MKTHDGFSEPKPDPDRQKAEDDYERRLAALDRAIRFAASEAGGTQIRNAHNIIDAADKFEAWLKGPESASVKAT